MTAGVLLQHQVYALDVSRLNAAWPATWAGPNGLWQDRHVDTCSDALCDYDAELAAIRMEIERSRRLIDQGVYRLYGLMGEEIAV